MTTSYLIEPVSSARRPGWVVKTVRETGPVETSIVYPTKEKAQTAAASWTYLDEDWERV